MSETDHPHLVVLDEAATTLRAHFLGWQCRIRQHAMRHGGGRPTSGMQPLVRLDESKSELGRVTVLIVQSRPEEAVAQLSHLARKTNDPAERYANALKFLSAAYYQYPEDFSDEMTALFGPVGVLGDRLLAAGQCRLLFDQFNQRYDLPCRLRLLPESHPSFQATYWHNAMFNPDLPGGVRVIGFRPDWSQARADPPAW